MEKQPQGCTARSDASKKLAIMPKIKLIAPVLKCLAASLFLIGGNLTHYPAEPQNMLQSVRQYRQTHEHEILKEFIQLLSIPNVSADTDNIRRNAEFIKEMMHKRGIEARIMETKGNPVIFSELSVPGATQTLMFYAHYDGQPVDPENWTGTHPFEPALRPGKLIPGTSDPAPIPSPDQGTSFNQDWRIYARGSSDDRAPVIGLLTAIDALRSAGISLRSNLKFILEGEEEAGSTNLFPFLRAHRDLLGCDVLFMCDGPVYFSGDPTLFFGVRGITSFEITVFGPNTSLHSGHFGNWAPNPAVRLAHLLASMRGTDGRVTIPGWYDSVIPLTERELQALQAVPSFEKLIKENYGFSDTEDHWNGLNEAIQYPALNCNGLHSGWVGDQQRTIVPPSATAALDIRLVKGNDPADMLQKVISHIQSQGYHVLDSEPDQATRMQYPKLARVTSPESGYAAYRTDMDLPIVRAAIAALQRFSDRDPVLLPSLGGSLPIALFGDLLQVPVIGLPIANHDNNQHQPDENLRIGHLWTGIETYAAILMLGQ